MKISNHKEMNVQNIEIQFREKEMNTGNVQSQLINKS